MVGDIRILNHHLASANTTLLDKCQKGFEELYNMSVNEAVLILKHAPSQVAIIVDRFADTITIRAWNEKANAKAKNTVVTCGEKILADYKLLAESEKATAFLPLYPLFTAYQTFRADFLAVSSYAVF